jgi:hypothetical protein
MASVTKSVGISIVLAGVAVALLAGCVIGGRPTSLTPVTPAAATAPPSETAVPGGAPTPVELDIAGVRVTCGLLGEADCRGVVSALGSIADGATDAEIGAPVCDGRVCPTAPPANLVVGVILRWGEGDLTKILTCLRQAPSGAFHCERAPVDLG